jgi:hypothetical protein
VHGNKFRPNKPPMPCHIEFKVLKDSEPSCHSTSIYTEKCNESSEIANTIPKLTEQSSLDIKNPVNE